MEGTDAGMGGDTDADCSGMADELRASEAVEVEGSAGGPGM